MKIFGKNKLITKFFLTILSALLIALLIPNGATSYAAKAFADTLDNISSEQNDSSSAQTNATTSATGYTDDYLKGTTGEAKITQTASWTNTDESGAVQAYDTANLNVKFDSIAEASGTEDPQYYFFVIDVSESMECSGRMTFAKDVAKKIATKAAALNSESLFGFDCFTTGYESCSLSNKIMFHKATDFSSVVDSKCKRSTSEGGTSYKGIMSNCYSCINKYATNGYPVHAIWITDGTASKFSETTASIAKEAQDTGFIGKCEDMSVIQVKNGTTLTQWSKGLVNFGDYQWGSYQVVTDSNQLDSVANSMVSADNVYNLEDIKLTVNIDYDNFEVDKTKDIKMPGFKATVTTTETSQTVTFVPDGTTIAAGTSYEGDIPLRAKTDKSGDLDVVTVDSTTLSYKYNSAEKSATPGQVQLTIPTGYNIKYNFNGGKGIAQIADSTSAAGANIVAKTGEGLANSSGGAFGGWLMSYTLAGSLVREVVKSGATFVMPAADVELKALYNSTSVDKVATGGRAESYLLSEPDDGDTSKTGILENVKIDDSTKITTSSVSTISFTENEAPASYAYRTNIADSESACPIYAYVINDSSDSTYSIQVDAAGPIKAKANSLVSLFGGDYDVTPSTTYHKGFVNCKSVDIKNLDCSEATSTYQMFSDCGYNLIGTSSSTEIKLPEEEGLATGAATNMNRMFAYCGFSTFDFSKIKADEALSMSEFLRGTRNFKKELNISSLNTAKCQSLNHFFANCSTLTNSLTMGSGNFTTSACKNFMSMFNGCSTITAFDMKAFDTHNAENMSYMFANCTNAKTITINYTSFNTEKVTTFEGMFNQCKALEAIDFSKCGGNVSTSMRIMFQNCSSLNTLTLPDGFITSECENIGWFCWGASALKTINIAGSNVSNLDSSDGNTSMSCVFYGCSSLTTIYCSSGANWAKSSPSNVTGMNMFYNCYNLPHCYSGAKVDKTYAYANNGSTGYFTPVSSNDEESTNAATNSQDKLESTNSVDDFTLDATAQQETTQNNIFTAIGDVVSSVINTCATSVATLFSDSSSNIDIASAQEIKTSNENENLLTNTSNDAGNIVVKDDTVSYELNVKNTGEYGSVSNDITVTDNIPTGMVFSTTTTPSTVLDWTDTTALRPVYAKLSGYVSNISMSGSTISFVVHNLAGQATLTLSFDCVVSEVAPEGGYQQYDNQASYSTNAIPGTVQPEENPYYPVVSGDTNTESLYSGEKPSKEWYTVSYVNAGGVTSAPAAPADTNVQEGSVVTLPTISASETYEAPTFSAKTSGGTEVVISSEGKFTMPAENVIVTITYKAKIPTAPTTYEVEYAHRGWDSKTGEQSSDDCPAQLPIIADTTVVKGGQVAIPSGLTLDYYDYLYDTKKGATGDMSAFQNSAIVELFKDSASVGTYTLSLDELNSGFFTTPTSTNEYNKIKVTMSWERKAYDVTYQYTNPGNAPDEYDPPSLEDPKVKWGENFTVENVQSADGYAFEGWFSDPVLELSGPENNSTNKSNFLISNADNDGSTNDISYVMPKQDTTFYGSWTKNPTTYTVSTSGGNSSVNGGTAAPSVSGVAEGDSIIVYPDLTGKTGQECSSITVNYTDGGEVVFDDLSTPYKNDAGNWYLSMPSMTDSSGKEHTGGITITCKFSAVQITAKFNANGGTFKDGTTYRVETEEYGSTYTLPTETPTMTGYTFDGWYSSKDGGTKVESTKTVDVTSDTEFWAHWTLQSHTVIVHYVYSDGGTASADAKVTKNYNETYSIESPAITGYSPDKAKVEGTIGEADITETVTYTKNSYTLTINYLFKDGTTAADKVEKNVDFNDTYTVTSPTVKDAVLEDSSQSIITGTMGIDGATYDVYYLHTTMNVLVEGFNGVYDGKDHSVKATVTGGPESGATIYYSTDNASWIPNPSWKNFTGGAQIVYVKVEASGYVTATGQATVNITKSTVKLSLTGSSTFDGTKLSKDVSEGTWTGLADGESVTGTISTNSADADDYTEAKKNLTKSLKKPENADINYTFDYSGVTLKINKADIKVTASSDQTYNGKVFSINSVDNKDKFSKIEGIASTDSAKITLTTNSKNAGTYSTYGTADKNFSASIIFTTGNENNYNGFSTVSFESVSLEIEKAKLSTDINQSVAYNSGNPVSITAKTNPGTNEVKIMGAADGENVTCVFTTTGGTSKTYSTTDSSIKHISTYADEVDKNNYTESFSAEITILPATVTTHTATFAASPYGYGTVTSSSATIVEGSTYKVTNNESGTSTITFTKDGSAQASVTATPATDSTEKYTFLYWKAGEIQLDPDTEYTFSADTTFTACFKMEDRKSLSVSKSCSVAQTSSAKIGDELTYTITIKNDGNVDLENIKVEDELLGKTGESAIIIGSLSKGLSITLSTELPQYPISTKDFKDSKTSITNKAVVTCGDITKEASVTTQLVKTSIDKPTAKNILVYSGEPQTGVGSGTGYTISDNTAIDAGEDYTATAKLDDGYVWSDGDTTDAEIPWKIAQKDLTITASGETTYNKSVFSCSLDKATSCSINGLVNNEKVALSDSTFTTAGSDADTYTYSSTEATKKVTGEAVLVSPAKLSNYKPTYNITLTINPKSLSDCTVTSTSTDETYDGNPHTPTIVVKDGEGELVASSDYTISGDTEKIDASNDYTISVGGNKNYTGTVDIDWIIKQREVSFTTKDATHDYNGEEHSLNIEDVTVENLAPGKNHTVSGIAFTNKQKNAGTYEGVKVDLSATSLVVKDASLNPVTKNYTFKNTNSSSIIINAIPITIEVYGNTAEIPFNDSELSVVGYTFNVKNNDPNNGYYKEDNVDGPDQTDVSVKAENVKWATDGTVDSYELDLSGAVFSYSDTNLNPTFDVNNGWLKITPLNLADAEITLGDIARSDPSGAEVTQQIKSVDIAVSTGTLTVDPDSYVTKDDTASSPGKYTLVITSKLKGNYTGSKTCTWAILGDTEEDMAAIGNVDFKFQLEQGAPYSEIAQSDADMINNSVSANELAKVAEGSTLHVYMRVKDATNIITPESKQLLDDAMTNAELKLGQYVDVSLFKQEGTHPEEAVHSTKDEIDITMVVPESLWPASGVDRTFSLLRQHDGVVEDMKPTYDADTHTLSFKSDKFSDYTIAYKDADTPGPGPGPQPDPPQPDPEPTPTPVADNTDASGVSSYSGSTGDNACTAFIVVALLCAFTFSFSAIAVRRKRTRNNCIKN